MDEVLQTPAEAQAACLQNRCLVDEALLRRAYRLSGRSRFLLMFALAALWLVIGIVFIVLWGVSAIRILLIVLALLYVVLALYAPVRNAKLQVRRFQELKGISSYENNTFCTEAELAGRTSISQDVTHLRYEDISFIRTSGSLILIQTKAKLFSLLDKDRFENGTEADFWQLIMRKRPDLRIPKH